MVCFDQVVPGASCDIESFEGYWLAIREHGIAKEPDVVRIFGIDYIDWATILQSRHTTVSQPTYASRRTAAEHLIERVEQSNAKRARRRTLDWARPSRAGFASSKVGRL